MDDSFDRQSRILVLSKSSKSSNRIETLNLVQSIIEVSGQFTGKSKQTDPAIPTEQEQDQDGATSFNVSIPSSSTQSNSSQPIPWQISNRYYSADVHFLCKSLPPFITGVDQKKKQPRTLAENRALREAAKKAQQRQSDSESKNVFEALSSNRVKPDAVRLAKESEEVKAFETEVEAVPAVVLVVRRDESLQAHRDLLAKISPTLFGFDLEVSLVVGLSASLKVSDSMPSSHQGSTSSALLPTTEDLVTLYAESGWEYINLSSDLEDLDSEPQEDLNSFLDEDQEMEITQDARELGIDRDTLAFARRPSLPEAEAGAKEETGIDRIKEALETYMWPNLERKDDRAGREERRFGGSEDGEVESVKRRLPLDLGATGFSDWKLSIPEDQEDQEVNDSNNTTMSPAPSTQPESADEALARAFLARLGLGQDESTSQLPPEMSSSFGFGTQEEEEALRSGALKPPAPNAKSWKELEDFLEDQDPEWPGGSLDSKGKKEVDLSDLDRDLFAELAFEAKEREREGKGGDPNDDEGAWTVRPSKGTTYGTISSVQPNQSSTSTSASATAFEDDFSDFVSAPQSSTSADFLSSSEDFPTRSEILATHASIFGPLSASKFKSKAARSDKNEDGDSQGTSAEEGLEFGQAMMAIQAHAERVRSIQDPEKRRKEAARVALAFGMGLEVDDEE